MLCRVVFSSAQGVEDGSGMRAATVRLNSVRRHGLAALGLTFAAVSAIVFLSNTYVRHQAAIAGGRDTARSFSSVLAEHTARTFEGVDRVLRETALIRQRYNDGQYTAHAAREALQLLQKSSPVVIAVGWTDATGKVQIHSQADTPPRPSIADLPYFIAHRDRSNHGLIVSSPFRSIATGRWITSASRRLNDVDGSFAGIVSAAVDPSYFNTVYRGIATDGGQSSVLLLHQDGMVVAREPRIESAIGKSFATGPLLSEHLPRTPTGSYETISIIDGVSRIAGYTAVPGLPLVVLVSYRRSEILAGWYQQLYYIGPIAVGIITLVLIGTAVLVRQTNRIQQQSDRLAATLDNITHGLCMFDADGRLAVCNRRFVEMFGLTTEQTKPGTPLNTILQARAMIGSCPQNAAELIERKFVRDPASTASTITDQLCDGRAIAVTTKPIGNAGWVEVYEDVTERRRAERELERTKRFLDLIVENVPVGIAVKASESRKFVLINRAYEDFVGIPRAQIIGKTVFDVYPSRDFAQAVDDADTTLLSGGPDVVVSEFSGILRSGAYRIARTARIAVRDEIGNAGFSIAVIDDITDRRRAEQELERTKQFLDAIIENVPVAIVVKDAKTRECILVNQAYERFIGVRRDRLLGRTVFGIYSSEETAKSIDASDTELMESNKDILSHDVVVTTLADEQRVVSTTRMVIRSENREPWLLIAVIDDVTDRKAAEQRIAHMALHDALTGLHNRVALTERIEEACARYRRRGDWFNIFLLDLDRFKQVNDTFGHPTGDALLKQVAERLKSTVRETDILARLGGDEFAILQPGEQDQRSAAQGLARRVIAEMTKPFSIDGNDVIIGASIGIALAPDHSTQPDELLKMADLALYQTKSRGRNSYTFFETAFSKEASEKHALEADLRRAIERCELDLHYQPIVDAKTRRISCTEALVRWNHPKRGLIYPDRFIPVAEECGLVARIGEWVLQAACFEAVKWPSSIKVAVNLSAVQLRDPFIVDFVVGALSETGLPPERLELEITETALMDHGVDSLNILRKFKTLGVTIALDDFGTGFSSLSHLTMFPFDKIKIDRTFIHNMTRRADCAAVISAVLALARSLDVTTTAEGVETWEQFRLLSLAGVSSMQGYLISRPQPVSQIDFDAIFEQKISESAA